MDPSFFAGLGDDGDDGGFPLGIDGAPHRRGQGYRRLWQQVSQVNPGDSAVIVSDCTVEDMLSTIKTLSPRESAVDAVRGGIGYLDSRALAFLFKELGKCKLTHRAFEIFDWLHTQTDADLANLCDVFTYTTIIAQCGSPRLLWKALRLVGYMNSKSVPCNIHTYSALMSVCVKAKQAGLALDVYEELKRNGLKPSVVTFNTLIDAYDKLEMAAQAVGVLDEMQAKGVKPESRTYNSIIRACNNCREPDQAYEVYQRMLAAGEKPTSATFASTIGAYCELGRVAEAVNVFNEMVASGCERAAGTYAQLLDAVEAAGQRQLLMQLLERMQQDGVRPEQIRAAKKAAMAEKAAAERAAARQSMGNDLGAGRKQPPPPRSYPQQPMLHSVAAPLQPLQQQHLAMGLGLVMPSALGAPSAGVEAGAGPSDYGSAGSTGNFQQLQQLQRLRQQQQAEALAGVAGWDHQPSMLGVPGNKRLVYYNMQLMPLQ